MYRLHQKGDTEFVFVPIARGASDFRVESGHFLQMKIVGMDPSSNLILPMGLPWTLVGECSKLTEEQWEELIDHYHDTPLYKNYDIVHAPELWTEKATISGHSLIKSLFTSYTLNRSQIIILKRKY